MPRVDDSSPLRQIPRGCLRWERLVEGSRSISPWVGNKSGNGRAGDAVVSPLVAWIPTVKCRARSPMSIETKESPHE
jgi:hypothetical protein